MSYKHSLFITLLSVILVNSSAGAASKLSEAEVFNRCYLKLFKSIVPRTASLGKSLADDVFAKKITASNACMVLLEQAEFMDNGKLRSAKNTIYPKLSEQEDRRLISNLHNFHNTWFSKKAFVYGADARDSSTYMMKDSDEASLYFTRALFGNAVPISTVFTSTKTLRGLREAPDKAATSRWKSKPMTIQNENDFGTANGFLLAYGQGASLTTMAINDEDLVPFGKLFGVEESKPLRVPIVLIPGQGNVSATIAASIRNAILEKSKDVDMFEHLGGGILGSQTFIMKNTNLSMAQIAPGANNDKDDVVSRRISSRVFEDLLCHQMPTLTEDDVRGDVIANSSHGFRLNSSCMACHTSLDPMANTMRNFAPYRTAANDIAGNTPEQLAMRAKGTPVLGITKLPVVEGSGHFALQKPMGSLNYRDHTNKLFKIPVNNLNELGNELSKSDDFYRCVAKRYYNFFTGYDVNLAERNVPEASNTKEAKFHRAKVYAIAANLKKSQNMTSMIKEIISSEAFVYRQYSPP
ncbi:hypothetical protein CIK05_04545 [Bdellovibrio sp. qaytius]|nr:hypothetical protein CIK05_04545 [Bdellovibrio sp. qaytius]